MSAAGERKAALLLATLRPGDRRWLLARMPLAPARRVRVLIAELEAMPFPVAALAGAVLADEAPGIAPSDGFDLERLGALVRELPPAWAARVVAAWGGFDARYCLSLLDAGEATAIAGECERAGELPRPLAEALRAEARLLAGRTMQEAA